MSDIKQIDELLSKELDTLENAISDENRALAICSREEIWKLIYGRVDLAIAERDKEIVEMVKETQKTIRLEQFTVDTIINLITNTNK